MTKTAMQSDAPSDTLPEAELIDKARAAKILGLKERRVLQLVTQGKLQAVKQRVEGSAQVKVMFRLEDVRHFKAERDKPKPIDITPPAPQPPDDLPGTLHVTGRSLVKLSPEMRDMVYLMNAVNMGRVEKPPQKPWLNLQEASEYSGLSVRLLRLLVRRGELPALRDEPERVKGTKLEPGQTLRIKRSDLDALEGNELRGSRLGKMETVELQS